MNIFPAIDLYQGCAVRLLRGDYHQMTVYSQDPAALAADFQQQGAKYLHLVDLEGARTGSRNNPKNLAAIQAIVQKTQLYIQLGGGIRSIAAMEDYRSIGIDRLILGTAAVTDPAFLKTAIRIFGAETVAVSVDLRNGLVATDGWTKTTNLNGEDFCRRLKNCGVQTLICTDISKDGAMAGTNRQLYRTLSNNFALDIIASGGISTLDDVAALADMGLYGAILGKALYTHAIDLTTAVVTADKGITATAARKEQP